jgi:hypothetical protein
VAVLYVDVTLVQALRLSFTPSADLPGCGDCPANVLLVSDQPAVAATMLLVQQAAIGLVTVAASLARQRGPAGFLGVVAAVTAVTSTAVFAVQMAVDGVALKAAVDAQCPVQRHQRCHHAQPRGRADPGRAQPLARVDRGSRGAWGWSPSE